MRFISALLLSAAVSSRALPAPTQAVNTCRACHAALTDPKLREPARQYATSAHRDDRIGCVGCHGGDPRDPTVEAHRAPGFDPHPTHARVPAVCGSCHGDAAFMRRINGRLPVGEPALFALSLHGKLTAAGDDHAPDCSTCHGKHDIVSVSSPRSPVNRANVAKACGGCHSDRERMARYDIRTDQYAQWQKSVHGQAFARGDPRAPTCTGCHGAHSAEPPEAASVADVCGRCHQDEQSLFEQSPHSKGFRERGLSGCIVCHGNHDVQPATAEMVGVDEGAVCMKCHARDDKPRRAAEAIAGLLREARERAEGARESVAAARADGLRVPGVKATLDQLATAEQRIRDVVHTLDPARVQARVGEVDAAAAQTVKQVAEVRRTRAQERRGYYVALALAGLLLLTLALKAHELDRRRRGTAP